MKKKLLAKGAGNGKDCCGWGPKKSKIKVRRESMYPEHCGK